MKFSRLYLKNLAALRKINPELADKVEHTDAPAHYALTPSTSGQYTAKAIRNPDNGIFLHSPDDPVGEAVRFIESHALGKSKNFIALGFGLGYPVLELRRRKGQNLRLIVIENSIELFQFALATVDFTPLIEIKDLVFIVGETAGNVDRLLGNLKIEFPLQGFEYLSFQNFIEDQPGYYGAVKESLRQTFQEAKIDLQTQSVLSRRFFDNIAENFFHILHSPGIERFRNGLPHIPAIIVAAGPSLDKNLPLLKAASSNAVVISVATSLKPLLSFGIEPDFVVALDPDETMVLAFDPEQRPSQTRLLFDPAVPALIPQLFPRGKSFLFDSGVFLYQWIAKYLELKGSLGKVLSVAHCCYLFARHLGCDPIILVGQDLAFNRRRLHCSGTHFHEANLDAIGFHHTLNMGDQEKFYRYWQALKPHPDVFGNTVTTTLALDTYRNIFAEAIKSGGSTINASEGGIPIPGMQNLPLREALSRYCAKEISGQKSTALNCDSKTTTAQRKNIQRALLEEMSWMRNLLDRVKEIKSANGGGMSTGGEKAELFVQRMEDLCGKLLARRDSALMVQSYAYRDFVHWNVDTNDIDLSADVLSREEILQKKLRRDRRFLTALEAALEHILRTFHRFESLLNDTNNEKKR